MKTRIVTMQRMLEFLFLPLVLAISLPAYGEDDLYLRWAMGSCNKQDRSQHIWTSIAETHPDLFLWLGDIIYGDTTDMKVLQEKYRQLKENPEYKDFRLKTPVVGVWDDHDYGRNNAGKEYPKKQESQQLFLDFLGVPTTSPLRSRQGIYRSHDFKTKDVSVKLLLLDTRFHRESPKKARADILGDIQWQWLEAQLSKSKAQVHFVVSSFSILSQSLPIAEEWASFPVALKRMRKLVKKTRPKGLMFLTGDRHFSGMLQERWDGQNVFELMSSGMTHKARKMARFFMKRIYGKKNSFFGKSYGLLDLASKDEHMTLKFRAISDDGKVGLEKDFQLQNDVWEQVL